LHSPELRIAPLTHQIDNQPPPLAGFNAWKADPILRTAVTREGGAWIEAQAEALAYLIGGETMQESARLANEHPPELFTHDRQGHRIDQVRYHPAYHELMRTAFGAGLHALAWTAHQPGAFVARAALNYLWNQCENGTACPVTMTFASVPVLRHVPDLGAVWLPRILNSAYDPADLPVERKQGATVGMAMTEKQGGSDLRANTTQARADSGNRHLLTGHKWFCSVPMSDAFLTLAQRPEGLSCFFVPRILPDGKRNRIFIQRLKNKLGNRSNASAEIEYERAQGWLVGEPGRGIPTLIEMAHLTRFDIVVAVAGTMRAALTHAMHHARHRSAFGRKLAEQPLMRNVLADLALESRAATQMAFRLAGAFDRANDNEEEQALARLLTPIAKYWLCKRLPAFVAETLECLGGNGYVEDWPLARLYREAPLNGVWEGSGNVICLDVFRALEKAPGLLDAYWREIDPAAQKVPALATAVADLRRLLQDRPGEDQARRVTEQLALLMQGALLVLHDEAHAAEAFIRSRLRDEGGRAFGTLDSGADLGRLIEGSFEF
jgi:putative acyl-CoA dehydrogenase